MPSRSYKLSFEIYDYPKGLSALRTAVQKPLSKYVARDSVSITVERKSRHWFLFEAEGTLSDVDACHILFNKHCLPDLHVVRSLDEAGDDIRSRAYPILSRAEQQLRGFINRVMTDVAGTRWWDSWCPPGVDLKTKERKSTNANDHKIELVDFTDLLILMTAQIRDWPDAYSITAKDLTRLLSDASGFKELEALVFEHTRTRSAWGDIFLPYVGDAAAWEQLKNQMNGVIIPIRHRVMHHRPTHLYHLKEIKNYSRVLRKHLAHSRKTIDEKLRRELEQLNYAITQTLKRAVSRTNLELFGLAGLDRMMAQQAKAVDDAVRAMTTQQAKVVDDAVMAMTAPFAAAQKRWDQQMRQWLDIQDRLAKQMQPAIEVQVQWDKQIEELTRGLRGLP